MHLRTPSNTIKAMAAIFVVYICAVAITQMSFIVDPSYLHELHRSLFAYHRLYNAELFADDYLTSVVGALTRPHIYEWGTRLWLWAGGDLIVLHRVLVLVAWLVFLAGIAVAARRLGDWITVLGVVGIAVAQPVYLHQIAAATPHAFAFPLLVWGIVGLLYGSARGLVFLTLLSSLLYTAMTPLLGFLLAWHLLITRRFRSLPRLEQTKVVMVLAAVAVVSLYLVLESLKGSASFGAALAPMQKADLYPENGPEGRYFYGVANPVTYVAFKAIEQFRTSDALHGLFITLVYCIVALYGLVTLQKGEARTALMAFVVSATALILLILLAKPFHLYRFILYPLFTVLPLLVMVGVRNMGQRFRLAPGARGALTLGALAFLVLASDSFDHKKMGYWWRLGPQDRELMAFANDQPPSTLFAVWPSGETAFETIPYVARRPLFVMSKAHYTAYEDHILTMRGRMFALIDAYLATDMLPLRALYCRWGVDYLFVNKMHFVQEGERPRYFAPFDERIERLWQANRLEDFVLYDPDPKAIALETESHLVLRLSAITPEGKGHAGADCGSPDD